jgi:hypothetical protein
MPRSSLGSLRESDAVIYQMFTRMPIEHHGLQLRNLRLDALDTSHVSFDFETTTASGTIDARLHDDGSLAFTQRPKDASSPWVIKRDIPASYTEDFVNVPVTYPLETAVNR